MSGAILIFIRRQKSAELDYKLSVHEKEILEKENTSLEARLQELSQDIASKSNKVPYSNSYLKPEDHEDLMKRIVDYMEQEKPYLNPDLSQSDVAANLDIGVHVLSEVLNASFKMNFNSFMNIYRVNEVKNLIKNPKYKDYKIIAIGYEAGFKSKTSFNRVFKNIVGLTPSEYREERQVLT